VKITNLWQKSIRFKTLSVFEKIVFSFLCLLEKFYKLGFIVVLFLKRNSNKPFLGFKTFSVGNLSVGGTGKSVFVQFLVDSLKNKEKKCAVVLRGYRSKIEKTKKSYLISDEKNIFYEPEFCGDEAFMLAQNLKIPVVVGQDRGKSCLLLKGKKIDSVILDDAYQNYHVKKDVEILLLDAKKPFENGHCLPAGRLREKDYSRADVIILTHADNVSQEQIFKIKNNLLKDFDPERIFAGRHKAEDLSLAGGNYLAFAGIGTFQYFLQSVKESNINITKTLEYPDHHSYSKKDLDNILSLIKDNALDGAITTQKDWCKLLPLIKKLPKELNVPIHVLNINFEFLSKSDHNKFLKLI